MRDKDPAFENIRLDGAVRAITLLGGPTRTAERLSTITGKVITKHRVTQWQRYGIAVPWHPLVHQLTRIPLHKLDPEIYPKYLFK